MFNPLNCAATTARRVFTPAARVTVERGTARKADLDRFVFGHQYGALFGLVIIDQIALRKGFAGGRARSRKLRNHPHYDLLQNLIACSAFLAPVPCAGKPIIVVLSAIAHKPQVWHVMSSRV